MIDVILCDDHALIRRGIRDTLSDASDIRVVGEAGDYGELRTLMRTLTLPGSGRASPCDVLVLDINLPGRSGLDALHALKDEGSTVKVLVVSMYPEDQYAIRALRAGAFGYVNKGGDPQLLVQAVRTVAQGRKYVTPEIAQMLVESLTTPATESLHSKLSDRELQTLVMIASGKRLADIAEALTLSPKTVSVYRARVLEKLQLANNSELTVYAIRNGLVGNSRPAGATAAGNNALDDPLLMRRAGRDVLSLALIDARNHLLQLLALDAQSPTVLRLALRAGWYQEYWIARHVQRARGEACDAQAPRLAGIEPRVDGWLVEGATLPEAETVRSYLHDTLETTLDLLAAPAAGLAEDDAALHVYRMALLHEDRIGEALAEQLLLGAPPSRAERQPLWLPAQRWMLGSAASTGGLVPHTERWAHEVAVPEFEIDAQAVNLQRYVEFAEDGGYDRRDLWTDAGWAWAQAEGRRAPRNVEQLIGGVLVARGTGPRASVQRAPSAQPVMHVSRHEAEAWCRWAGRRLPTEPEWEIAAHNGAGRGFVWGDVAEWVAGSARWWSGEPPNAACLPLFDTLPGGATDAPWAVLRGASFATRRRWHHPKARRFAPASQDTMFAGFRSCSV